MNNIKEDRDADSSPSIISPLLSPRCYRRMCVSGKLSPLKQRKYKFVGENHLIPVCLMPSWLSTMLYPLVLRKGVRSEMVVTETHCNTAQKLM